MIDNLYSQFNKHPNIGVACLYADYNDQSNQTLNHILGSFLRQFLSSASGTIPSEILDKLRDIRRRGGKPGTDDNIAMLKTRLHQFKRAFICLDAIDELEQSVRWRLLKILKELGTNNACLFLTGRHHIQNEVQKYFQVVERYIVNISATQQDIQEFVKQQIEQDRELNPEAMNEVLAKDIIDAVFKKSRGM